MEHKEELRCVIAVIRHGDRTPKQKMKMMVSTYLSRLMRVHFPFCHQWSLLADSFSPMCIYIRADFV